MASKRQFMQAKGNAKIMRIFALLLVLFLACFQAGATDILFNLAEQPGFGASPYTNRQIVLQQQSPWVGNNIFLPLTDTNGLTVFSNAQATLYNCYIAAPPGKISFQLIVTTTNGPLVDPLTGTGQATIANGTASTYPAGSVSYPAYVTDLRYALSGTASSNAFYPLFSNPSNYVNTNLLGSYVLATTNGYTYIIYSNPASFATTQQLASATNQLATTNYVNGATNGFITVVNLSNYSTTNYVNDSTNLLSNSLSNNIIQATNGLYLVLSQQIINATNPIPAQILAAATAVTNNPAITFFGTNVYTGLSVVGGEISNNATASGIFGAINIDSQTNGFGSIVFFNSTRIMRPPTSLRMSAIAGVPTSGVTNGFASTQDVANAVAGPASHELMSTRRQTDLSLAWP